MVQGTVNIFKSLSYFTFLHLNVCRFSFFLLPFARQFIALLLKECLRVAVFAPLEDSARSPFHCTLSVFCMFCLIVIAVSALHILFLHFKLVFICSEGAIASLLWTTQFYFHLIGGMLFLQVTRSEVILL